MEKQQHAGSGTTKSTHPGLVNLVSGTESGAEIMQKGGTGVKFCPIYKIR